MKKGSISIIILILAVLISVQAVPPVKAPGLNVSYTWQGMTFEGYDDFYGSSIVAFAAGSTATLTVNVINNVYSQMNISAVKVEFNWNQNFSAAGDFTETNPRVIPYDMSSEFVISFTVPSTGVSNLFERSYSLIIEHVNGTTAPTEPQSPHVVSGASNFVVYSADQAAYRASQIQYSDISTSYTGSHFTAVEAYSQYTQAKSAHSAATTLYSLGNFSGAKSEEQNAVTLYNQAVATQKVADTMLESNNWRYSNATVKLAEANASKAEAEARYIDAQTHYYDFLADAWIIFSVGFLLMGVGVVVYAIRTTRKPKEAAPSTSTATLHPKSEPPTTHQQTPH